MKSEKIIRAKRKAWVSWMLLTLLFFGIPFLALADVEDISDVPLKFYPYITAGEEYNNNILLSPNGFKKADYITAVNPGVRFLGLESRTYGLDLDFSGGYTYYAKNHDLSYWNAAGKLNSWYALTPRLTFGLRDYLVRSDQARENVYQGQYNVQGQYIGNTLPDQYLVSTIKDIQAIYFRNVVTPFMNYRFGRENLLSVSYENNIYRNENPLFEDSMGNTLNPKLTYWFDIRNGVSLNYYVTLNTYQTSPNQLINSVTPRYIYRLNPRASIFGEYHFEYQDFASPGVDYYVQNPSLGIQYQFSPTLVGIAQGGYFWQVPKRGSNSQNPSFNVSLTQTLQKTQYTLALKGGYTEDYVSSQNLGFVQTYGAYGTIQHWLTERLSIGLTGSMYRYLYPPPNPRRDWVWVASGGLSYSLFQWLDLSLVASYIGDNSNISVNNYTQFRGMFTITVFRPGYRPNRLVLPGYTPIIPTTIRPRSY